MRKSVDGQPAVAIALIVTELLADAWCEDLGAAAGKRIQPCFHQLSEDLLVRLAIELSKEGDLDGREALQVDRRLDPFEAA